jgi:Ca-activated chloride channel family protein
MLPAEFHFLRPGWLLLLPLVPLALLALARARRDRRRWEAVCDPALLPHVLIDRTAGPRRRWPGVVLGLAGLLGIVALAGPAWERLPQPVFRSQSALVVALDLSRSMEAADLAPSRLARATFALRDILEERSDGQTGLVVFAADAFVVSPLTDDTGTILAQLPALEPAIMPAQGSRPERGIELAVSLLSQAGAGRGDILLLTDGAADGETAAAAARRAARDGYRVSVLAAGTPAGAPIPAAEGGFVTDATGGIVVPRLDEPALRALATAGAGAYARVDGGPAALGPLSARWNAAEATGEETGMVTDSWLDRGPWLAALIVPLALLGFRRGVLLLAVCVLLPVAPDARAAGWDDLWTRPDQQGAAAMAAGEAARAQTLFEDRRWRAAAAYRAGDYEAAARALEGLEDAESLYNRGNALARAGRFDEALASYDAALEQVPDHEDAQHNRDLLRELAQPQGQGGEGEEGEPGEQGSGEDSAGGSGDRDSRQADAGESGGEGGEGQPKPEDGAADDPSSAGTGGRGSQGDPDSMSAAEREALARQAGQQDPDPTDERPPANPDMAAGAEAERDAAAGEEADDGAEEAPAGRLAAAGEPDETEQATEQWLRRIPDDPGGLLRRKFYYQYRERGAPPPASQEEQTW